MDKDQIFADKVKAAGGDNVHPDFEVFGDPAYFDMWALRRKGEKTFYKTIHFMSEKQAIHASHVVAAWMNK